ncbi:hypothetical protein F4680DRAFT_450051 [Xylaria scruposa]|nr:hypothetical protein F4680DRAFT_450051 [Xylaria scruposa]
MAGSFFDNVPVSPWTERYGTEENPLYSLKRENIILAHGVYHSGIGPLNPRLHPKYYDYEPRKDKFEIPTRNEIVDDILLSEEFQRSILFGNPTWRVAPLNSVLSWDEIPDILGGHRPGDDKRYPELLQDYMEQRINVDERKWFPFFRRSRWYNMDLESPETIVETDGTTWETDTWSVDDERIWKVIRFSLEIANRILLVLIQDNNRWLGTLLYGRIQMWYELNSYPAEYHLHIDTRNYRILMDPDNERDICRQMGKPFLGQDIEPDAMKRYDHITNLLRGVVWSFLPSVQDELMHAISRSRLSDGRNISTEVQNQLHYGPAAKRYQEPYVEDEPIREMGRSFEAAVFGGTPLDGPFGHGSKYAPNISMQVTIVKYPSAYALARTGTDMDTHPSLQYGAPIEVSFIPAASFWRLQSKAFWGSLAPNEQDRFLYPKLFTTTIRSELYTWRGLYRADVIVDPDAANGIGFQNIARRWNERVLLWARMRKSWYDSASKTWLKTPWGYMQDRRSIDVFRAAYKARDEAECASMAWELANELPAAGFEDRGVYPDDVTTYIPEIGSVTGNPPLWLFHCLGLLMLAALPFRTQDYVPPKPNVGKIELRRSRTVSYQITPIIEVRGPPIEVQTIVRRDRLFSRLEGDTIAIEKRDDFIAEALDMIGKWILSSLHLLR